MVHPPVAGALPLDAAAALASAGLTTADAVVEGAFVAVLADREAVARRRAETLAERLCWDRDAPDALLTAEAFEATAWTVVTTAGSAATFRRPIIAHGSIGPSCGLARFDGARLTVITHSQGVFALRRALAAMLASPSGGSRSATSRAPAATATTVRTMQRPRRPSSPSAGRGGRSASSGPGRTSF
jgi:CO/xanthine dehydrogenase Mo-binding subunit